MIMAPLNVTLINSDALNLEMQTALGALFLGLSTTAALCVALLDDSATQTNIDQAQAVAAAHNPAVMLPAQDARTVSELRTAILTIVKEQMVSASPDLAGTRAAIQAIIESKPKWVQALNNLALLDTVFFDLATNRGYIKTALWLCFVYSS